MVYHAPQSLLPFVSNPWWLSNLIREWIQKLRSHYTVLFKIVSFGISSGIGFLVAEVILTVGVLLIFGSIRVKTSVYASPLLLALDLFALIVGVTVSFFINQNIIQMGRVDWPRTRSFDEVVNISTRFVWRQCANNCNSAAAFERVFNLPICWKHRWSFGNLSPHLPILDALRVA